MLGIERRRWVRNGLFAPYHDQEIDPEPLGGTWDEVQEYVAGIDPVNTIRGVFFVGPPGVGKTLLAHWILANVLVHDVPDLRVYAETAVGFMEIIQEGMSTEKLALVSDTAKARWEAASRRMERVRKSKWVLLDDLGTEHETDWSRNRLSMLIRDRGNKGRPTIITTNRSADEFASTYGEATYSYIHQSCVVVSVEGEDQRLAKR